MFKKISISIAIVALLFFVGAPAAQAQVVPAFGGLISTMIPCTCVPAFFLYTFTPLFLTAPVPLAGVLVGPPAVAFSFYSMRPGAWALGLYTPGAGAVCMMAIPNPPYCIPVPNIGLILPTTGVSPEPKAEDPTDKGVDFQKSNPVPELDIDPNPGLEVVA